jgi:Phage integrase family
LLPRVRAHPHEVRHTLATQAINRGMRPEAIAALLGHRSMEMSRRRSVVDAAQNVVWRGPRTSFGNRGRYRLESPAALRYRTSQAAFLWPRRLGQACEEPQI